MVLAFSWVDWERKRVCWDVGRARGRAVVTRRAYVLDNIISDLLACLRTWGADVVWLMV